MSGLGPAEYSADTTQGSALLAVSVTTSLLALLSCALRFCIRLRADRRVGKDDIFLGSAMLLGLIGMTYTIIESIREDSTTDALRADYLAQPWLNLGSTLSKVSICFFLLQLVSQSTAWKVFIYAQITSLLLINAIYCLTIVLRCRPIDKLWDSSVGGQCWNLDVQHAFDYVQCAFDTLSGLAIALFAMIATTYQIGQPSVRWPLYILSLLSIATTIIALSKAYKTSSITSNDQLPTMMTVILLAILHQNLTIFASNIISIFSSRPGSNRSPLSESEASVERDNWDATSTVSRVSHRSKNNQLMRRRSVGMNSILKDAQSTETVAHPEGAADAWPLGIIKTVSVEVTREHVADIAPETVIPSSSGRGSRQS